jgi:hypothetical protein
VPALNGRREYAGWNVGQVSRIHSAEQDSPATMRLLNTTTLEVEEFLQSQVPEYVILSHTWREEEVTTRLAVGSNAIEERVRKAHGLL